MNGVLVIDKPEGPTSHDIVAAARRLLGVRQIGHTGTLDPMATGVLPLAVGRATRLVQFLTGADKTYDATVRLGVVTDSYDRLGTIIASDAPASWPDAADLDQALDAFRGAFLQAPPPYSAKKIDGIRAYVRARRGDTSVLPAPVPVHVRALELLGYAPPLVRVRLTCSPGFYVRALAHDLGGRLGTGAILDALRRTASGSFTLQQALPVDALADATRVAAALVPLAGLLTGWPSAVLVREGLNHVIHGRDVGPEDMAKPPDGSDGSPQARVRLLSEEGDLVAIAEPTERPGFLHPALVLK